MKYYPSENITTKVLYIEGPKSSFYKENTLSACVHHVLESMEEGEEFLFKEVRRLSGARENIKVIRQVVGKVKNRMGAVIETKRFGSGKMEHAVKMVYKPKKTACEIYEENMALQVINDL